MPRIAFTQISLLFWGLKRRGNDVLRMFQDVGTVSEGNLLRQPCFWRLQMANISFEVPYAFFTLEDAAAFGNWKG